MDVWVVGVYESFKLGVVGKREEGEEYGYEYGVWI